MKHNILPISISHQEKVSPILVVDDNPDDLIHVSDVLAMDGLVCITAATVAEAISILQSSHNISMVILDWCLDRCGARVIQAARKLDSMMPVLVVSGSLTDPRPDAFTEHVDAFLQKPYHNSILANQVKQLLKRKQNSSQAIFPQNIEQILRLDDLKNRYVQHVVQLVGNNLSVAAAKLGVHRQTLATALRKGRPDGFTEAALEHSFADCCAVPTSIRE